MFQFFRNLFRCRRRAPDGEARFRTLVEITPVGVFEADRSGALTYVNDRWCAITGLPREKALGSGWHVLLHPDDADCVIAAWSAATSQGAAAVIEWRCVRPDGSLAWFVSRTAPLVDDRGEVVGFLGTTLDATKGEAAVRQLERQSVVLSSVLDNMNDAVVVSDSNGQFVILNPAAETLLGRDDSRPEDGYGVFRSDGVTPYDEDSPLARAVAGMATADEEVFVRTRARPEGSWAKVNARPVIVDGQVVGGVAVFRDVTEEKRSERRTEDRLRDLVKRLEASNRELQQFATIASHDLQEPLRKICAFGDRLSEKASDSLDPEARDCLDRMLKSTSRMQRLINDLLTFSRVTRTSEPFVEVDLGDVLRSVLADLEVRVAETKGSVLVGDLPVVRADHTQMRQLFQNLIGNALKFHREGVPPLVRVSATTQDGRCWLAFEDNGIGFEQKYADHIFKVFQRLHPKSRYEGTGIGLAIVRKIAERHGGHVSVTSRPGEGSTFVVVLKLDPEACEGASQ